MSRRFHGPVSVFLGTFWSTLPRENGSSHPDSLGAYYGTRSTKNWKLTLFFHYIFQTFIVITSRFGTPHVHRLNKAKSLYIFGQNHPVRKFSLHITTNQYPFILPFLWIGNSNNITFSQKKRWILIFFKKRYYNNGGAGFRTPDLSHAKRALYHWATPPDLFNQAWNILMALRDSGTKYFK